jgi:hypothetical protein
LHVFLFKQICSRTKINFNWFIIIGFFALSFLLLPSSLACPYFSGAIHPERFVTAPVLNGAAYHFASFIGYFEWLTPNNLYGCECKKDLPDKQLK